MKIYVNQPLFNEIQNMYMKISIFAHADLDICWSSDPFLTTVNRFYMITEGEAYIRCDGRHVHMMPGNIYVIPSGTMFSYTCPNSCRKLYFSTVLLNSNGEKIPLAPPGCIILPDRAPFIAELEQLYQKSDYRSAFLLRMYAEEITREIFQNDMPIHQYSSIVSRALRSINSAPHMSVTASVLARDIGVSPGYLRDRFAKETGIPLGKYVRRQVLLAVETDLFHTDLTLQQISNKYGFCDQFHFSRSFSAFFGRPPSRHRKKPIF